MLNDGNIHVLFDLTMGGLFGLVFWLVKRSMGKFLDSLATTEKIVSQHTIAIAILQEHSRERDRDKARARAVAASAISAASSTETILGDAEEEDTD